MNSFTNFLYKQKGYMNLLEALSIDDFDEFNTDQNIEIDSNETHEDIDKQTPFLDFVKKRIIGYDDSPLTTYEQQLVNTINNNINYQVAAITPSNLIELKNMVKRAVKFLGNNANLNWIDTSRIDAMLSLFDTTKNSEFINFNGDISLWDVSNVRNMLHIFNGCQSLNCDLSKWNPKELKFWNTASYAGTNSEFKQQCKAFGKRANKLVLKSL